MASSWFFLSTALYIYKSCNTNGHYLINGLHGHLIHQWRKPISGWGSELEISGARSKRQSYGLRREMCAPDSLNSTEQIPWSLYCVSCFAKYLFTWHNSIKTTDSPVYTAYWQAAITFALYIRNPSSVITRWRPVARLRSQQQHRHLIKYFDINIPEM